MSLIPRAVLFGNDEMLNLTRRWILERAGFTVLTAQRITDMDRLLEHNERVDLFVLCSSTNLRDCLKLLATLESRWPEVSKLWVGRSDQSLPDYLPSDVITSHEGTDAFYLTARRSFSQIMAVRAS